MKKILTLIFIIVCLMFSGCAGNAAGTIPADKPEDTAQTAEKQEGISEDTSEETAQSEEKTEENLTDKTQSEDKTEESATENAQTADKPEETATDGKHLTYTRLTEDDGPDISPDVPAQVDPGGEKVELSPDEQKKLNLFISNFAEQRMNSFDYGHPDMYKIGHFAYTWSLINNYKDVKVDGDHYYVSIDAVKKAADRYFGLDISDDELAAFETPDDLYKGFFKNGNYYVPASDGESYPTVAVVDSAEDVGGDIWRLEFTVYDINFDLYWDMDGEVPKEYYALTPEEATQKTGPNEYGRCELTETERGYAIVNKDGDKYKLRYYEIYG